MNKRVKPRAPTLQRFAEVAAMLFKQKCSHERLLERMGLGPQVSLLGYINALKDEGLVYIAGWESDHMGRDKPVYAWQPSVCFFQDAPRPMPSVRRVSP